MIPPVGSIKAGWDVTVACCVTSCTFPPGTYFLKILYRIFKEFFDTKVMKKEGISGNKTQIIEKGSPDSRSSPHQDTNKERNYDE